MKLIFCARFTFAAQPAFCFDLRFDWKFVASSRHADVLLVTGAMTHNMKIALERTYAATLGLKSVVAVGDCGCGRVRSQLRGGRRRGKGDSG